MCVVYVVGYSVGLSQCSQPVVWGKGEEEVEEEEVEEEEEEAAAEEEVAAEEEEEAVRGKERRKWREGVEIYYSTNEKH